MAEQDESQNLWKEAEQALLKMLQATLTLPGQATFYAAALGAIVLAAQGNPSAMLLTLVGQVGYNALADILGRVARGIP